MTDFGQKIGTDAGTISRYESGKLVPSRPVLILLLGLANQEERRSIFDTLGVRDDLQRGWNQGDLDRAVQVFEEYLAEADQKPPPDLPESAFEFMNEAFGIIQAKKSHVDQSVVRILKLWRTRGGRRTKDFFRNAAAYLEVQLSAEGVEDEELD